MLKTGILNPAVLNLLARIRHTNTLVISDRGFPYWPQLETIDLSLVDDVPTVMQVLAALRPNFDIVRAYAAEKFRLNNSAEKLEALVTLLKPAELILEPFPEFKKRVPLAIGLIRTADTTPFGNLIIESG